MKRDVKLQAEPLWYLRGLGYGDYLQSNAWRIRKAEFVKDREMRCARCGLATIDEIEVRYTRTIDSYTKEECSPRKKTAIEQYRIAWEPRAPRFHVHHLTYERLGHELNADLQLVCAPCHNLEHRPDSNAGRWWKQHIAGDEDAYEYEIEEVEVEDEATLVEIT